MKYLYCTPAMRLPAAAPLRLEQFLGPHPAPMLPLLPLWPLTLKALFPGEQELHAAEPGSMRALPP